MLIALLILLCSQLARDEVYANGYDVYASPLAWSPDGTLLAAAVNDVWPRDDTLASGALRLYGRNGEIVAELARGMVGTPSFSPDGKLLVAVVDGNLAIYDVVTNQPWEGFRPKGDSPAIGGNVLDCLWESASDPEDGQQFDWISFTAGERFYGCSPFSMSPADWQVDQGYEDVQGGSIFRMLTNEYGVIHLALEQNGEITGEAAYERLILYSITPPDVVIVPGEKPKWPALAAKPQSRPDDYHESNALFLDDHTVLFQRGGWGDWKLYRIDLVTQEEQLEVADAQQPALDGSGTLLAYVRRDWQAKAQAEYDWDLPSTVRLRNRATGEDVAVSTPEVYAELPALSPDGERIAWLEQDADGMAQVAIRTVPGVIRHGPGIVPGDRAEN